MKKYTIGRGKEPKKHNKKSARKAGTKKWKKEQQVIWGNHRNKHPGATSIKGITDMSNFIYAHDRQHEGKKRDFPEDLNAVGEFGNSINSLRQEIPRYSIEGDLVNNYKMEESLTDALRKRGEIQKVTEQVVTSKTHLELPEIIRKINSLTAPTEFILKSKYQGLVNVDPKVVEVIPHGTARRLGGKKNKKNKTRRK